MLNEYLQSACEVANRSVHEISEVGNGGRYLPHNWVAHITIAIEITPEQLKVCVCSLTELFRPFTAEIDRIALIKYEQNAPYQELAVYEFTRMKGRQNMLRLRPYKPCDAIAIASWIKNERALRLWSSDRFGDFPISAEAINDKYLRHNGDCPDEDNFYPMTAFDENGTVGHLILRFTDKEKSTLRFGFVIVDDSRRGTGCGREMLKLAMNFAFDVMGADRITLGVFDCNQAAYRCYKSVGFSEVSEEHPHTFSSGEESWTVIELAAERKPS